MTATENETGTLSRAQEDYLKQIFLLAELEETVTTQALADKLSVRPPSVTGMLKKLSAHGLVEHEPYRGVRLTDAGRQAAMKLLRLHRLLETFLHQVLGYTWDQVHDEAERLEHVISERFERRMAETLGNPTHDPHGDPIPSAQLDFPPASPQVSLSTLDPGQSGTLVRVLAQDRDTLTLLTRLALVPGAHISVVETLATGVRLDVDGERLLLPLSLAAELLVAEVATR